MINILISIKPLSVNDAFQGRRFKTAECKQYEKDLWVLLPKKKRVEGKYSLTLDFFLRSPGRGDISNLVKILEDILVKKGYVEDDRYCYDLRVRKHKAPQDSIGIEITPFV